MELPTEIEQRRKYLDQIKKSIPQGAIDLDSLINMLSDIDQKNHKNASRETSERFARNTLFGIRRVFEKSERYNELLVKTRAQVDNQPVPITYVTSEGIKLLAECETPNELFDILKTDDRTIQKADIRPGLFNSLHHALVDKIKSSE